MISLSLENPNELVNNLLKGALGHYVVFALF